MIIVMLTLLLAHAGGQQAPPPTALITGRVVDGTSGAGVRAATVSIQVAGVQRRDPLDSVLTDAEGRYFFDRLPKGSYAITVRKPGWIDGAYGQRRPEGASVPLGLAADERRANVDLKLWKRAVLAGTVLDEAGEPLVNVLLWSVRRTVVAGKTQMQLVMSTRTDDRGMFRLSGLSPGEYTVLLPATVSSGPITFGFPAPDAWYRTMSGIGVQITDTSRETGLQAGDGRNIVTSPLALTDAPDGSGAWMAVPSTLLPNVVTLGPGEERGGLTITTRHVPTQSISGTLVAPGELLSSFALHLLPADMADFPVFDVATAITDAAGAFTFYGIPSGSYVIRMVRLPPIRPGERFTTAYGMDKERKFVTTTSEDRNAAPLPIDTRHLQFANVPVTVGTSAVKGITVTLREGVRFGGRVEFEGTAPRPTAAQMAASFIGVDAANGFSPFSNAPYGQVAEDGTFATKSVLPGAYVLHPGSLGAWTVKSVTVGGRDVTELPIDAPDDVLDAVITYTDRAGSITGVVNGANGQPDGSAEVLIFPANKDMWMNTGAQSKRFVSARTSATATFSIAAPPPGAYLVVALADEDAVDWKDPATLAKLAAAGQSLAVQFGESPSLTLQTRRIR